MAIAAITALSVNGRKNLIGDFQRTMTADKARFENRAARMGATVDHYEVQAVIDDLKSSLARLQSFKDKATQYPNLVQAYRDDIDNQSAPVNAWATSMLAALATVRDDARVLRDSKSPISFDADDKHVAATFSTTETADLKLSLERLGAAIDVDS